MSGAAGGKCEVLWSEVGSDGLDRRTHFPDLTCDDGSSVRPSTHSAVLQATNNSATIVNAVECDVRCRALIAWTAVFPALDSLIFETGNLRRIGAHDTPVRNVRLYDRSAFHVNICRSTRHNNNSMLN